MKLFDKMLMKLRNMLRQANDNCHDDFISASALSEKARWPKVKDAPWIKV
jgi:hypothetical protein